MKRFCLSISGKDPQIIVDCEKGDSPPAGYVFADNGREEEASK